jgi:hypothetical protein
MIELVAAPTLVRLRPVGAGTFCLFSGIRRLLFLVVPVPLLVSSCASPVTWSSRHFGAGAFIIDARVIAPGVKYLGVRGVGVVVIDNRLCIGAVDSRCVQAEVQGRSYAVQSPLAEFAVGAEAEKSAYEFLKNDGGSIGGNDDGAKSMPVGRGHAVPGGGVPEG